MKRPVYRMEAAKNRSCAGMWDNSIIILSSDHGGINKGHGGKGVKKGNEVKESIVTYDTAATIAYIFGLKTPRVWTGRPVKEAFAK